MREIYGIPENVEEVKMALDKSDALDALQLYFDLEILILGIDVLILDKNGDIRFSYDSWYTSQLEGENYFHFIRRSYEEAVSYIKRYNLRTRNSEIPLFDITVDKVLNILK